MFICSMRFGRVALVALALALPPPVVNADAPDPAAERVAGLDAGTFLVAEVHPAKLGAGKPDIPSTPKSEIKTVAEQLEAQTPLAQLGIEAAARDPSGQSPQPS